MVSDKLVKQLNLLESPAPSDEDCAAPSSTKIFAPANASQMDGESLSTVVPNFEALYSSDVYAPTLRTGDFNIDGYPDILFTVRAKNETYTVLCTSKDESITLGNCNRVGDESILGAFFDLDEDGY